MSRNGSLFQSQLLLLAACLVLASVDATFLNPMDFITKSCETTTARNLCLKSLSPFANTIKTNQAQACQVAFETSLRVARRMAHSLTKLSRQLNASKTENPKVVEAVNFCLGKHKDAVVQLNSTSNNRLTNSLGSEEVDGYLDDFDMCISLATSYMGECKKEWDGLPDTPTKFNVCRRSDKVAAMASIALELLRNLQHSVHSTDAVTAPPANCRDCVCCPGQKLAKGQCCQCCDAPPLPLMQESNEELASDMCEPNDEACKQWVNTSN